MKRNANTEYQFCYNPTKTLAEQNVSKKAKSIIALLYRDYCASSEQRRKILDIQNQIAKQIKMRKKENMMSMFLGTNIVK